jgi:hypothetical protein
MQFLNGESQINTTIPQFVLGVVESLNTVEVA